MGNLRFWLRQWWYDLSSGLFFIPALGTVLLGVLGLALTALESNPAVALRIDRTLGPFGALESAAAQLVLSTIAASMMTTVAVAYSVLLMVLSLASMQYSPRVLTTFLRGRAGQLTLGAFLGTFTFCVLVLPQVHADPPFVPRLAVGAAVLLALVSVGLLLWCIHAIAASMQINFLADDIVTATLAVLEEAMPIGDGDAPMPTVPAEAVAVLARRSGYVQLVDEPYLARAAERAGVVVLVACRAGEFVVVGEPIAWLPKDAPLPLHRDVSAAFDLGPLRTLQQDVGYGVRQLVDVALKAISPAVNDPTTAVHCVDQITRVLCAVVARPTPDPRVRDRHGVVRVWLPRVCAVNLVDLAWSQLRQYGASDLSMSLRLLRGIRVAHDRAEPQVRERLRAHARLLVAAVQPHFAMEDCVELVARLRALESAWECPTVRVDAGPVAGRHT